MIAKLDGAQTMPMNGPNGNASAWLASLPFRERLGVRIQQAAIILALLLFAATLFGILRQLGLVPQPSTRKSGRYRRRQPVNLGAQVGIGQYQRAHGRARVAVALRDGQFDRSLKVIRHPNRPSSAPILVPRLLTRQFLFTYCSHAGRDARTGLRYELAGPCAVRAWPNRRHETYP